MGTERLEGERLLVQRMWTNFRQNMGWNISKVSSRKQNKKKMPLFLKHFNGWHQNVKLNILFFKKIKNVYLCITTSKKTKHIKNRN